MRRRNCQIVILLRNDAKIIAPGPDYKWHVSTLLDERLADNEPLLALEGKTLMLPKDKGMWPNEKALEWRMEHLLPC